MCENCFNMASVPQKMAQLHLETQTSVNRETCHLTKVVGLKQE